MLRRLSLLLALLVFLVPAAFAQENALLLGLRYPERPVRAPARSALADTLERTGYRSLLFVQRPDGRLGVERADGLLVPRPGGVWLVGVKRSQYNRWVEDFVWATTVGTAPVLTGVSPFQGEHCAGFHVDRIRYAGPDYLAVEKRSAGYCDGAAHPFLLQTLAMVPFDSLRHEGLDVARVLGAGGMAALQRGAQAHLLRMPPSERARYLPEPDPANWGLARRSGRWMIRGRLDAIELTDQGRVTDFELPGDVPRGLIPGAGGIVVWGDVARVAADAVDAFMSPANNLIVIQRRTLITVHPVERGQIGSAVFGFPIQSGSEAVVVRWVGGAQLGSIRTAFRQASFSPGSR